MIVHDAVYADLEPARDQFPKNPRVDRVPGAEIERRPIPELFLQIGHIDRETCPRFAFDIVPEHKGGPMGARPEP